VFKTLGSAGIVLLTSQKEFRICAIIPAFNEGATISDVVRQTAKFVSEVIVVDDHSTDSTQDKADRASAHTISNRLRKGAHYATLYGIKKARCEIIVTLDADGQHPPEMIPGLVEPIINGRADFVLARRNRLPPSERLPRNAVSTITHLDDVQLDVGTGFRAFKRELLAKMSPQELGLCGCGSFLLYAYRSGARITEVRFVLHRRAAGSSKFANVGKYKLHREQANFLLRAYGGRSHPLVGRFVCSPASSR
jgi:glycosyltransferase involved in cell wall biosynthesis